MDEDEDIQEGISPDLKPIGVDDSGSPVYSLNEFLSHQINKDEAILDDVCSVFGECNHSECSYSKGYLKRQALYSCHTCIPESSTDFSKAAGICLACSLKCHDGHDMVELYTKRNFRCDCGNSKFNNFTCKFSPDKNTTNNLNNYNQNFTGLYCTCARPYPDPDDTIEDDMISCTLCEDWFHTRHLGVENPPTSSYEEMVCESCIKKHDFLLYYDGLSITKVESGETNKSTVIDVEKNDTDLDCKEVKVTEKNDESTVEVEKVETIVETLIENKVETPIETTVETPVETMVETSIETSVETKEEKESTKVEASEIEKEKSDEDALKEDEKEAVKDNLDGKIAGDVKIADQKDELDDKVDADVKITETAQKIRDDICDLNDINKKCEEITSELEKSESLEVSTKPEKAKISEKPPVDNKSEEIQPMEATAEPEKQSTNEIQPMEVSTSKTSENTEKSPVEKKPEEIQTIPNLEVPNLAVNSCKKPTLKSTKRTAKFFENSSWRQQLCTCPDCLKLYADEHVSFLIDTQDTLTFYKEFGKVAFVEGCISEQQKKIDSLDHAGKMYLAEGYAEFREKFRDFLVSFQRENKVVREEDVREFFGSLESAQKRRKMDMSSNYFCR